MLVTLTHGFDACRQRLRSREQAAESPARVVASGEVAGNNGLVVAMKEKPSSLEIAQRIAEALHPRRVVLFGSRARGDAGGDSDFDLMVEMESDLRPHERARQVYGLFGPRRWSMDVVVYTPREVLAQRRFRNSLIHAIEREGKVLYEQPG